MGMMKVDDIRPFPGCGYVAWSNLLRTESRKGERTGHRQALPGSLAAHSSALHGHDLHLMTEIGSAFDQCLNDTLHTTRARPVVLGQMKDTHAAGSPQMVRVPRRSIFPGGAATSAPS